MKGFNFQKQCRKQVRLESREQQFSLLSATGEVYDIFPTQYSWSSSESKRGSKALEKPDCMAEVSNQVGVHEQQFCIILIKIR